MNKPASESTDRELLIRLDERMTHLLAQMSPMRKRVEAVERKMYIASGAVLVIVWIIGKVAK